MTASHDDDKLKTTTRRSLPPLCNCHFEMIIPITITSSSSNPKLPSGLAKISHNEVVIVELQGSLEVECNQPSERDGKLVGQLKIDDSTVNQYRKF
jgi:hypothetical protein